MDAKKFEEIFNESRNGCSGYFRHWAVRNFVYTDGVKDLADTGVHWLLDIIATEVAQKVPVGPVGVITCIVDDSGAAITLSLEDDAPAVWARKIDFTDMPIGKWAFIIQNDGTNVVMILTTEY